MRKYGIKFFAYSPLACASSSLHPHLSQRSDTLTCSGGLLTGKMLTPESGEKLAYAPGSRWDPNSSPMAAWYVARYAPLLDVVRELKVVTVRAFNPLSPRHLRICLL